MTETKSRRATAAVIAGNAKHSLFAWIAVVDRAGEIWTNVIDVAEWVRWKADGWRYHDWSRWNGWVKLPSPPSVTFHSGTAPVLLAAGADGTNHAIELFARGTDNNLYRLRKEPTDPDFPSTAAAWQLLTTAASSGSATGPLSVAYRSSSTDTARYIYLAWGCSTDGSLRLLRIREATGAIALATEAAAPAGSQLLPRLAMSEDRSWILIAAVVAGTPRRIRLWEYAAGGTFMGAVLPQSIADDAVNDALDVALYDGDFHVAFARSLGRFGAAQWMHAIFRGVGPAATLSVRGRIGPPEVPAAAQPILSVYRHKLLLTFLSAEAPARSTTLRSYRWENTIRQVVPPGEADEWIWTPAYVPAGTTANTPLSPALAVGPTSGDFKTNAYHPNPDELTGEHDQLASAELFAAIRAADGRIHFTSYTRSLFVRRLRDLGMLLSWYPADYAVTQAGLPSGVRSQDVYTMPTTSHFGYITWLLPEWLMQSLAADYLPNIRTDYSEEGYPKSVTVEDGPTFGNADHPFDPTTHPTASTDRAFLRAFYQARPPGHLPIWICSHNRIIPYSSERGDELDAGSAGKNFFGELGHELVRALGFRMDCRRRIAPARTAAQVREHNDLYCGKPSSARLQPWMQTWGWQIFSMHTAAWECSHLSGADEKVCMTLWCGPNRKGFPDDPTGLRGRQRWDQVAEFLGDNDASWDLFCRPRPPGFLEVRRRNHGCHYDCLDEEHSFIWFLWAYMADAEQARAWAMEDLAAGDNLLLLKYWWVSSFVFRTAQTALAPGLQIRGPESGWWATGVEFSKPFVPCPTDWTPAALAGIDPPRNLCPTILVVP